MSLLEQDTNINWYLSDTKLIIPVMSSIGYSFYCPLLYPVQPQSWTSYFRCDYVLSNPGMQCLTTYLGLVSYIWTGKEEISSQPLFSATHLSTNMNIEQTSTDVVKLTLDDKKTWYDTLSAYLRELSSRFEIEGRCLDCSRTLPLDMLLSQTLSCQCGTWRKPRIPKASYK